MTSLKCVTQLKAICSTRYWL